MFTRLPQVLVITTLLYAGCVDTNQTAENMTTSETKRDEPVSIRFVLNDTRNSKPPAFKHSFDMSISNKSKASLWIGINECDIPKIDKDYELIVRDDTATPIEVTKWINGASTDDTVITLFLFTDPSFYCIHVGGESQVLLTDIEVFTKSADLQTMNILTADDILIDGGASIDNWLNINMMSKAKGPVSINHAVNQSEYLFRSDSTSGKSPAINHPKTVSLRGARPVTVSVEKAADFVDYTKE